MSYGFDNENFIRQLSILSQKVKDLEQEVLNINKVDTVENRNVLNVGDIITDGGQELSTPKNQTYTGITSTGALVAVIDLTSESYNTLMMQIVGNDNTGTFTSATVDLEYSLDGTNYLPLFSLTASAGDLVKIDEIKVSAFYLRYNVTAITLVGDADLDITLGAILT